MARRGREEVRGRRREEKRGRVGEEKGGDGGKEEKRGRPGVVVVVVVYSGWLKPISTWTGGTHLHGQGHVSQIIMMVS